jgi:hypothetical protein
MGSLGFVFAFGMDVMSGKRARPCPNRFRFVNDFRLPKQPQHLRQEKKAGFPLTGQRHVAVPHQSRFETDDDAGAREGASPTDLQLLYSTGGKSLAYPCDGISAFGGKSECS